MISNTTIIESKSLREIEIIRDAAKLVCEILKIIKDNIKINISTLELEEVVCETIKQYGVESSFKGYRGYPACSCISINDELVHGIPKKEKKICNGDIVSIDIGIKYKGFYADVATTVLVRSTNDKNIHSSELDKKINLLNVTYQSILEVLPYIKEGVRVGDIGSRIQEFVERNGYNVIREYVGHTIGRQLHEKPDIPNFGTKGEGVRLVSGMVICIEPMVSTGGWQTTVSDDGWTVKMKDGSLCAHFEHMILVGKDKSELLSYHDVIKPQVIIR